MNNFGSNPGDNRRPMVAIVIAVLAILGIIFVSNTSYQNGVTQGMLMSQAPGAQVVVPNANGDGTHVVPAPAAPSPYYQYGNRTPFFGPRLGVGRFGFGFGFGVLGFLVHILLIGGVIFLLLIVLAIIGPIVWGSTAKTPTG